MADTNPPLPKSGGSGPIIIAAVLMLFLIGGLIVWKVTGSSGEPPKPTPMAETTPTTPTVMDEPPPPPPPPPPPEESAKPDDKEPKKAVGSTGGSPCSKVCTGVASAALQSALAGRGAQARGCYQKALSTNATLQGTMLVSVKVGPGGQVCGASVTNDTLGDPMIKSCVTNHFRASQLPAPEGGCADVNVPLRFMPKP
jgi:hypothetical protein